MKLYPFQEEAVAFAKQNRNVILAHEMGLGKTLIAIRAIEKFPVLVVCPNSLKWFWQQQFRIWRNDRFSVGIFDGSVGASPSASMNFGIYIIHYEALRKWWPVLAKISWGAIIVDEAHRIKNRKAQQTKAIKKLSAPMKLLLTGTPIINRPDELWSLLHFLFPKDKQYTSYWRWFNIHVLAVPRPWGGYDILGVRDPKGFREGLRGIIIRRTKADVLPELPEKTYTTVPIDLGPEQRKAYDQMRLELMAEISDDVTIIAREALSKLIRLRQLAIGLGFFDPENTTSAKIDAAVEMIQDWNGKKVVVCSEFVWPVRRLVEALKGVGITAECLTGKTPQEDRAALVEAFQTQSSPQVLCMTSRTGGIGITLTAADTMIFIDKPFAPAYTQQAEDRLHRIGQRNSVQIITLLARKTVDERIEKLLQQKQAFFSQVFRGDEFKKEFLT